MVIHMMDLFYPGANGGVCMLASPVATYLMPSQILESKNNLTLMTFFFARQSFLEGKF